MAQTAVLPGELDAWFYVADDQPVGPLSASALAELHREGRFPGDTLVWKAGTADWLPFAESPASAPPPPPAPAPVAAAPVLTTAAGSGRQPCAVCGKDWPEALMTLLQAKPGRKSKAPAPRWTCRPCANRSAEEIARHAKVKDTSGIRVKKGGLVNWPGVILIMAAMVIGGVVRYTLRTGRLPTISFTGSQAAEKWSSQPPELWPTLTLASELTPAAPGAPAQPGANAVLVRRDDDGRLAVLTLGAGVPVDLAGWKLLAPAGQAPLAMRVAPPSATVDGKGILPIVVEGSVPADEKLPATPLRLRQLDMATGVNVFAVSPGAGSGKQTVYRGKVLLVHQGEGMIEVILEKHAPVRSLNGSALLDVSGHLVGVITGSLDGLNANNEISSVTAVDTPTLRKLLRP